MNEQQEYVYLSDIVLKTNDPLENYRDFFNYSVGITNETYEVKVSSLVYDFELEIDFQAKTNKGLKYIISKSFLFLCTNSKITLTLCKKVQNYSFCII